MAATLPRPEGVIRRREYGYDHVLNPSAIPPRFPLVRTGVVCRFLLVRRRFVRTGYDCSGGSRETPHVLRHEQNLASGAVGEEGRRGETSLEKEACRAPPLYQSGFGL